MTESILLEEEFGGSSSLLPEGWTAVDDDIAGSSDWYVGGGRLVDPSGAGSGSTDAASIPKPGPYVRHESEFHWTD